MTIRVGHDHAAVGPLAQARGLPQRELSLARVHGGHLAGGLVHAPDLPVVGVGDQQAGRPVSQRLRVLEERRPARAIRVAEIEEAGADEGPHLAPQEIEAAYGRGLAVGDVEPRAGESEARGLCEGRRGEGAVVDRLPSRAGHDADRLLGAVQGPDLVRAGHGDEQEVAGDRHVPGRAQRHRGRRHRASRHAAPEGSGARDAPDAAPLQAHFAYGVVARVRDEQQAAILVPGEALGAPEPRVLERAVGEAGLARADHGLRVPGSVEDEDTVVARVRDSQPPAREGDDLGGEGEGAGDLGRRGLDREARPCQRTVRLRLGEQARDRGVERSEIGLSRRHRADRPVRPHEHERGPRSHGVGTPDPVPLVHHDRVPHAVARHGLRDAKGVALGRELGRVDADHHHRIAGALVFQGSQHGEHVQAVDSAIRPEVQDDDVPPKLRQAQRAGGAQPPEAVRQLRRVDAFHHERMETWRSESKATG
jgi:hypothetical protein